MSFIANQTTEGTGDTGSTNQAPEGGNLSYCICLLIVFIFMNIEIENT